MKNILSPILMASAAFAFTVQLGAAEPLLSPRAKANQTVIAPRSAGMQTDVTRQAVALGTAAKNKALSAHTKIAGTSANVGLAHSRSIAVGSPRGLQQLRDSGRFQIAPLK